MMSDTLTVGVTGHRRLGEGPRVGWYVHAECVRLVDRLRGVADASGAELVACSALAIGADMLFAQAALGLGLPLVGVVPFEDYPADFEGPDRAAFESLLGMCRRVERLPGRRRSDRAYLKGGLWVVDNSDFVIAVWNGLPAAGLGGTGDVVEYARRKGKPVLRIDPARGG
jgi:hypothetical protein